MRRLAALLIALSLLLVPVGAEADPGASAGQEAGQVAAQKYAHQAVKATNAQRDRAGLRPLRVNRCLQRYAVRQAAAMASRQEMYHQELGPILARCGLQLVGENVAFGFEDGRSTVDDGWMNSEGHRANILNRSYRLVAIGAARSADGSWYVSQVFGRR